MPYSICPSVIQLIAIAGCRCGAFLLTGFFCWSFWHTICEGIRHLKKLHQVPCDSCQYFTGEYLLKCTVHPCKAFSEEAIDCLGFAPNLQTVMPRFDRGRHPCLKR